MNKKARPNTLFYLLVQLLYAQSAEIPINIELLNAAQVTQVVKKYTNLNRFLNFGVNTKEDKKFAENL